MHCHILNQSRTQFPVLISYFSFFEDESKKYFVEM